MRWPRARTVGLARPKHASRVARSEARLAGGAAEARLARGAAEARLARRAYTRRTASLARAKYRCVLAGCLRDRASRWVISILRALVLVLALPIATAGALPCWALLAGVEGTHVCRCSIERHDCVCARCNPGHDDTVFTTESLTGRCGDDEVAFSGKAILAVLAAPAVRVPAPSERVGLRCANAEPPPALPRPPPTPPPRPLPSPTA